MKPSFPSYELEKWYKSEKRDLPWRKTKDPYAIWVSEIFLQQTQVERVKFFYTRFLQKFPTVFDLAKTSWEEFFPYFEGLGYYRRGKNMLQTAQELVENQNGIFPNTAKELEKLPGIGKYTAAAIASFAFDEKIPALDVNLFRVFGRFFEEDNEKKIVEMAKEVFQNSHSKILNHAFMDLGSGICTAKKTDCLNCPIHAHCNFFLTNKEIPLPVKKSPPLPKNCIEMGVVLLHHGGKYFVVEEKNFPIFERKKGEDLRHMVKKNMEEIFAVGVSVRPECFQILHFFDRNEWTHFAKIVEIVETPSDIFPHQKIPCVFRFVRCQLTKGSEEKLLRHGKWRSVESISKHQFFPFFKPLFPKLEKMRFPKENHVT